MGRLKARYFALVLLLLLPTLVATLQLGPYLASQRLKSLAFWEHARPAEQRQTAEQALDYWLGDPHDAFIMLGNVGDASSIPIIRRAIARQPPSERLECTWAHAERALAKLEHRS